MYWLHSLRPLLHTLRTSAIVGRDRISGYGKSASHRTPWRHAQPYIATAVRHPFAGASLSQVRTGQLSSDVRPFQQESESQIEIADRQEHVAERTCRTWLTKALTASVSYAERSAAYFSLEGLSATRAGYPYLRVATQIKCAGQQVITAAYPNVDAGKFDRSRLCK